MTEDISLGRLVYLLVRYRVQIPRRLRPLLPGGNWLSELHKGVGSASLHGIEMEDLSRLYRAGKKAGPGSADEAKALIAKAIDLGIRSDAVEPLERIRVYSTLERFMVSSEMLEEGMIQLDAMKDEGEEGVPKFDSGFLPIDLVLRGCYQGILTIMGYPGTGKTSLMLTMMEEIASTESASSVVMFQNEIPKGVMAGRVRPITERVQFREGDLIICASWGTPEILSWVEEHPDPDRVVFFDCPDVIAEAGEGRRFALEGIYQDLVKLKQVSKMVVTSSQPRRRDGPGSLSLTSVAEAWAKAWYTDMLVSIQVSGRGPQGRHQYRLRVHKNRFGPSDGDIVFTYDLTDLTWELEGGLDGLEEDWW